MITVFLPSGTSSVTSSRTRLGPNDFARRSSWIIPATEPTERPPRTPSSQQHQRPECVQDQNRLAAQDDGPRGGFSHALRAALRVEAAQAAHQRDRRAEAGALDEPEPDVLEAVELL